MNENELEIIEEANRCLQCKNPNCIKGCPLSNDIPGMINLVKNNKYLEAYGLLMKTSILSDVCSRVCNQYDKCMGHCILGIKSEPIQIGKIEKFVSDYSYINDEYIKMLNENKENIDKKIAIIGTGPSAITCAYYLSTKGHAVTMFEKEKIFGGVLATGIPEYRLPRNIIEKVRNKLEKLGVEIKYNMEFGKDINYKNLEEDGYCAIYLGIGLSKSKMLNIEGEELDNIFTSKDFLYNVSMKKNITNEVKDKKVVVIGGGNVAIDVARTAINLQANNVTILYRRNEEQMFVVNEEKEEAKKCGVKFEFLSNPVKFIGNKKVEKIECIKMMLGDLDISGRQMPVVVKNSNYEINADIVIMCIGCELDKSIIANIPEINISEKGLIIVNEKGQTSIKNVFAGGDIINENAKSVAFAGRSGIVAGMGLEEDIKTLN